MKLYTTTDLARFSGANPRSVQHWAASQILLPQPETNRAGTGTRRLFNIHEAVMACVMQTLTERQINIGEMQRVASIIRQWLLSPVGGQDRLLGGIIRGQQAWFVTFSGQEDPAAKIVMELKGHKAEDLFTDIFVDLDTRSVAIVFNLTAVLKPLRGEI